MRTDFALINPVRKKSFGVINVASIAMTIMSMVLFVDMLTGPLRFYLSRFGLDSIVYIPKVAGLLFVFYVLARESIDRRFFYILLLIFFSAVIGATHQVDVEAQLFSLYLIAPFLFGVAAAKYLQNKEEAFVGVMIFVFMITVFGVFLDVYVDLPWAGFMYGIGGVDIEGSREWTTMGYERVAGFARLSSAAAFYVVCSSMFLFSYSRSLVIKFLVMITAFTAVLFTTNKAGIFGFIVGFFSLQLVNYPRILKIYVFVLVSVVILLPLSTVVQNYDLNLSDPFSFLLLASFEDRLMSTWPSFISAVDTLSNPVTGMGLGGIGTAVKYFANGSYGDLRVADNFALYLYGCFGLMAVIILLFFARITTKLFYLNDRLGKSLAPVMVIVLAASLTTDVIESQVCSLFLGIALGMHSLNSSRLQVIQ